MINNIELKEALQSRGYSKELKKFVVGYYNFTDGKDYIMQQGKYTMQNILVEPLTVGRCFGLKDDNGVLIFEGDKVEFDLNLRGGRKGKEVFVVEDMQGSLFVEDWVVYEVVRWREENLVGSILVVGHGYEGLEPEKEEINKEERISEVSIHSFNGDTYTYSLTNDFGFGKASSIEMLTNGGIRVILNNKVKEYVGLPYEIKKESI